MNFVWIRDLQWLAEEGNFSRAARRANLSQPAFSRRIMAFETWAGTPLADRSRQPVRLTPAGERLLEAGQLAIGHLESERDHVREAMRGPDRHIVSFAVPHSIGWRFFPAWMDTFEQRFGPVPSRMRADDLHRCVEAFDAREVDFLISYESRHATGLDPRPGLESLTIGRDVLVPVARAGEDGLPVFSFDDPGHDPSDNHGHDPNGARVPWLRFGQDAPISRHLDPLIGQERLEPRLRAVYENAMAGALRIRARDGAGLAWLPRSLVAPDLESGALVVIDPPHRQVALAIKLYRLRDHANPTTDAVWTRLVSLSPGETLVSP